MLMVLKKQNRILISIQLTYWVYWDWPAEAAVAQRQLSRSLRFYLATLSKGTFKAQSFGEMAMVMASSIGMTRIKTTS